MSQRDGAPAGYEMISLFIDDRFDRHDRARRAYDHGPGIQHVHCGVVRQLHAERLERLIVQFVEEVTGRHAPNISRETALLQTTSKLGSGGLFGRFVGPQMPGSRLDAGGSSPVVSPALT